MLSSIDVTNLKRYKLWVFIVVSIVILAITISFFRPVPPKIKKKADDSLIEVKYDDDSMQKWIAASELQLKELLNRQKSYKKLMEKQSAIIVSLQKKEDEQSKNIAKLEDKMGRSRMQDIMPTKNKYTEAVIDGRAGQDTLTKKKFIVPLVTENSAMEISYPPAEKGHKKYIMPDTKENSFLGWLPMGSFFSAILLNGIEAGTGSNAEANPQPVLMRITDNAILPNIYRYRVASCFILGSAYGSLSSERAFIRTIEISCVGHKGQAVITAPLKGFVVDSDGKIGLRGLLVNRQGEKLGKAMLSGFFGGLSGIFGQIQGISTTGPLGMANMLSANASLSAAGLNGVSNATNELAQFYISEAKRLFPVIEINAGRTVTINLSQGVSLRWQLVTRQPLREEEASSLVTKSLFNN